MRIADPVRLSLDDDVIEEVEVCRVGLTAADSGADKALCLRLPQEYSFFMQNISIVRQNARAHLNDTISGC
jgi:hypothetical protein